MKRQNFALRILNVLKVPLIILFAAIMFFAAITSMQDAQNDEMRTRLEDALRQGAVACYAAEGKYPESLEYLEKNYGVQIDRDRYYVFYEAVAENLMPSITVVEK